MQAVVLDMGGVLIPEVRSYELATRDAQLTDTLRQRGIERPEHFVEEHGRRLRDAYRALEKEGSQPDADRVWSDLEPGARKLLLEALRRCETQRPYSYAREVVALLARRYRLGLVSNNVVPGDQHARALRTAGILEHLECALWSANTGRRKPDPWMLERVLEALRVPARHAVFVGDKLRTDVAAAQRARVRSVYLARNRANGVDGPRPDFVIRDLRSLPGLLKGL